MLSYVMLLGYVKLYYVSGVRNKLFVHDVKSQLFQNILTFKLVFVDHGPAGVDVQIRPLKRRKQYLTITLCYTMFTL